MKRIYCNATDQFFPAEQTMNIVADILPYTLLIGAMVARYLISAK
ncbi:MAG: hypothetical protein GAK35_03528 [Herbaspirillum frisingense]|uniref:Uncharacterized protein n=1 Tax=Herbaspirillum frisingense TaxID=92645 RepID=A0A7V8FU17_9BURK|nr:MAG: hypothetical protein GAK35_03528 [Herbaspirillum frisingense]